MGWDGSYKPSNVSLKQLIISKINGSGEKYSHRVVKICVRPFTAAYAAVERTCLATGDKEIYGLVVAIRHEKGGYVATKEMDESMHPYFYECPADILDILSPTNDQSAQSWREKCRGLLTAREALKSDLNSAKEGAVFRFKKPALFTKIGEVSEITLHAKKGRKYAFSVGRYAFYATFDRLFKMKDWYGLEVVK